MQRRYKNNRDFLDALTDMKKITPDGKEWITLALDPFHDYNKQIAGYPDADASQTVVSCFQYQADLVAPGAVNWDCHIYNAPVCKADDLSCVTLDANWKAQNEPNPVIQTVFKHGPGHC